MVPDKESSEPLVGRCGPSTLSETEMGRFDFMKAYVITTGIVFGLVTLAHIWRAIEEGPGLAEQPWFILLTIAAAALCVWALRLLWRGPKR